jgi:hypothetical protein
MQPIRKAGVRTGRVCKYPSIVNRLLAWFLTTPILVVGLFAGHELGYRLAHSGAGERARTLDETGHSYFTYAPYLGAALAAVAVLALGLRVRGVLTGRRGSIPSWGFALLPPLGFVLLEAAERLSHGGLKLDTLAAPELLLGLALQLPFAIAALLVARAVLRLADAVGVALRRSPARWPRSSLLTCRPAGAVLPRARVASLAYGERGPPCSRG